MASAERTPFPSNPEEFDADDRISFSKVDNKFILEAEDGQEFEYDHALKRWVEVNEQILILRPYAGLAMQLDDALVEQQRQAYAVSGVDESEPAMQPKKKRKQVQNGEQEEGGRQKKHKPAQEPRERKNTAVYITNLPLDADTEEVQYVFSKCGVIAEEIDSGKPRVKLYEDDKGQFKGDALVVYFRPESVDLAIQMLDDTDFRLGQTVSAGKMKVAAADFSYKRQTDAPTKPNTRDKQKIIKRTQKLNNRLADWSDDEPSALPDTSSRLDKVVILKHMFTLSELSEDPAAMLDIKDDIREECSKLGEVTNVVLYDLEPDGVASVRFSTPEAARECVRVMDGRFFAGTKVVAYVAKGGEKYRKSNAKKAGMDEDEVEGGDAEAEEEKRLDAFGEWLEEGDKEAEVDEGQAGEKAEGQKSSVRDIEA